MTPHAFCTDNVKRLDGTKSLLVEGLADMHFQAGLLQSEECTCPCPCCDFSCDEISILSLLICFYYVFGSFCAYPVSGLEICVFRLATVIFDPFGAN